MLKSKLIHPPLIQALAAAGHGGKILITDSNYAFSTNVNPAAARIHLNLMPDCVTVTQVLEAVISAVPIEAVDVMNTDDGQNRAFGQISANCCQSLNCEPMSVMHFTIWRWNVIVVSQLQPVTRGCMPISY